MSLKDTPAFRPLEDHERKLLERLLDHHDFPGRDEVRQQLESATARTIAEYNDNYGSFELRVADSLPAAVDYLVPVEAEYFEGGVPVWILLHVDRDGFMRELEIVRADGKPLISRPVPERIEPFAKDYGALMQKAKPEA